MPLARGRRLARWAGLGILWLLASCDAMPGRPAASDMPLRPAEVRDFDRLYAENCAGCHGADGKLGAAQPMNDPVYLTLAGRQRLVQVTAQGVPNSLMPGFGTAAGGWLTGEQIDILVDGMVSRWGGSVPGVTPPAYAASPAGDAQRGAAAFGTYCGQCHGASGKGGEKGRSVVDGSFLSLMSDQALRTSVICGRPDLGMPDWRGADGTHAMSGQDVDDVVAWLIAQRPQYPGQPYGN